MSEPRRVPPSREVVVEMFKRAWAADPRLLEDLRRALDGKLPPREAPGPDPGV